MSNSSFPGIIVVMGATGTGKSQFINVATDSGFEVGEGLKSCTTDVAVSPPIQYNGGSVVLVDTPGFDDTMTSDMVILARIGAYLERIYREGRKLHGIIYMHRITDRKMTGTSRKNMNIFREICGYDALVNVCITTNMWNVVDPIVGATREEELKSDSMMFQPLLAKGAQMLRHFGTRESAMKIIDFLVRNTSPRPLLIQRELVEVRKDMTDTSAAQEIDREVALERQKYRKELDELKERMAAALKEGDLETHGELKSDTELVKERIQQLEKSRQNASQVYAEEKRREADQLHKIVAQSPKLGSRTASRASRVQIDEKRLPPTPQILDRKHSSKRKEVPGDLTKKELADVRMNIKKATSQQLADIKAHVDLREEQLASGSSNREQGEEDAKGGHSKHASLDSKRSKLRIPSGSKRMKTEGRTAREEQPNGRRRPRASSMQLSTSKRKKPGKLSSWFGCTGGAGHDVTDEPSVIQSTERAPQLVAPKLEVGFSEGDSLAIYNRYRSTST
ncbi:unnamed protein product [Somion occarium]|uniref:G domain-containing protein n=1 Tax=Somion occarium TaxID=3059160 RepID=A0ABP1EBD4_9APHY